MKVIITGTPGVGKTTVSKAFAKKHGLKYVNINQIAFSNGLVDKNGVIKDMKKLEEILKKMDNCVIDGHLACEMKLNGKIVVLRCDPEILKKRLEKRGYHKKKLIENLEAECLDYCEILSNENYKKVFQIDCSNKKIDDILEILEEIYFKNKDHYDSVDFSNYILKLDKTIDL